MKIAVTGGAGFIGSHIVDAYIEAGHEVVVIDNFSTGRRENVHPLAHVVEMDIRDPAIIDLFAEEKFDVLNHHAAQMNVRHSLLHPEEDTQINIFGSLNLFEAAKKTGVKKIIFASSGGAIYGEQNFFPADERHSKRPRSPYGVSKLWAEKYLVYYRLVHQLPHFTLRYTNVYGPRQNPKGEAGVVAIFITQMLQGQTPVIYGDGTQTRDFLFVEDAVRANLLGLQENAFGIFNCSTAFELSINTLFQLLKYLLDFPGNPEYAPPIPGEIERSVCSYRKLRRSLGWTPKVSIEEGLRRTIEWFRAHPEFWQESSLLSWNNEV